MIDFGKMALAAQSKAAEKSALERARIAKKQGFNDRLPHRGKFTLTDAIVITGEGVDKVRELLAALVEDGVLKEFRADKTKPRHYERIHHD
jgi:hypothetical protein